MQVNAFYSFPAHDLEVDGNDPVATDLDFVINEIFPLFGEYEGDDNTFLGLIDQEGTTLQMVPSSDEAYEKVGDVDEPLYWVEIPSVEEGGSWGADLPISVVFELLQNLTQPFTKELIPNALFISW